MIDGRHWTHEQELDLLELGREPARCLKGENNPARPSEDRARLVAGRAARGLNVARRLNRDRDTAYLWGRRPNHFYEELLEKQRQREEFERRRVAVRDKKVAALEKREARLRSTLRIIEEQAKGAR